MKDAIHIAAAALGIMGAIPAVAGTVEVGYQYPLADFTGTIPYSDAGLVVDATREEIYSVFGNEIRVFGSSGMEIYRFSLDPAEGRIADLAAETDGSLLLLVYQPLKDGIADAWSLRTADYRGRLRGEKQLERSDRLTSFRPNRMLIRSGAIWLVSTSDLRAAAFSKEGTLERVLDLAAIAGIPAEDRPNVEIGGFDVDPAGNVLFTVPVQFRVHVVAPDGTARSFGRVGSAAGNFGNVAGVASDGQGHVFVSDRLRGVVMVFDDGFRFLREFGQTGAARERLARPGALALSPSGRLYVSQLRNRGIAVYAIRTLAD